MPAYVALGGNLGDPRRQVAAALDSLGRLPHTRLIAHSRLYRSRPMGPQDQPDFINAAAGLLTQLDARSLLREMQGIETVLGRTPSAVRWGPRLIDLDLLVYGSQICGDEALKLPHPAIHERNFVLYPLAEIAPDLFIPGRGTVVELARQLGSDGLAPAD